MMNSIHCKTCLIDVYAVFLYFFLFMVSITLIHNNILIIFWETRQENYAIAYSKNIFKYYYLWYNEPNHKHGLAKQCFCPFLIERIWKNNLEKYILEQNTKKFTFYKCQWNIIHAWNMCWQGDNSKCTRFTKTYW